MLTRSLGFGWGHVGWGLALAAVVATACGGSSKDPPAVPGETGTGGKGHLPGKGGEGGEETGTGGMGDAATGNTDTGATGGTGGTGGSSTSPDAPIVTITSPVEETDPNGEGVIVDDMIEVTCSARPASGRDAKIDPSTVSIDMLDAEGNVVQTVPALAEGKNLYTASFITTKVVENGVISFKCSAADDGTPPLVGTGTVQAFVDHGPEIIVDQPAPDSQHALVGAVDISFQVKAAPVAKGDKGAAVSEVTLEVAGVPVDLTEMNGAYSGAINLADPLLFQNAPEGPTQVAIRASNRREPKPGVNDHSDYTFIVDGTGPEIVMTAPAEHEVIGGDVIVQFDVKDAQSGVDPDSVVVRLNNTRNRYDPNPNGPWRNNGATFTYKFDARQFDNTTVQTTITVEAYDLVGNKGDEETVNVYLDNVPPVVDLDPPAFREYRKGPPPTCSLAFDPLGPLAANDLAHVYDFQLFRAFVYDRTNEGDNQTFLFHSNTDTSSVYLYLQPDPSKPLLTDTDGDGACDNVIDEVDPMTQERIPLQQLTGLLPTGSSWFGPVDKENADLAAQFPIEAAPDACGYGGDTAPPPLCLNQGSDMTRIVQWDVKKEIPLVFVQGPSADGACTGIDWQIGHQAGVSEGWLCVAAVAKDGAGNLGVSQPLRLCYDDGVDPPPDCLDLQSTPPTCVDDCSLPPKSLSWEIKLL